MDTINQTPFMVMSFPAQKPNGEEFLTTIVKGTFKFSADGGIELSEDQEDVRMADEYFTEPNVSSLRQASDLLPFKPTTDIHIIGAAYSKGEVPVESWDASVSVDGDVLTELTFTGKREWRSFSDRQWVLSDISKTNIVALKYEHSSGGQWQRHDEEGGLIDSDVSHFNPLGTGLVDIKELDPSLPIAAPQILKKGESIPELGQYIEPAGLSPIPGSWKQRLQYAGTYDEEWESNKWPLSPDDFDWHFYQSAHPDLICEEYLQGGETITLKGLTAAGELSLKVPDYLIAAKFFNDQGHRFGAVANLDTVEIELNKNIITLVWRMTLERETRDLVRAEVLSIEDQVAYLQQVQRHYEKGGEGGEC